MPPSSERETSELMCLGEPGGVDLYVAAWTWCHLVCLPSTSWRIGGVVAIGGGEDGLRRRADDQWGNQGLCSAAGGGQMIAKLLSDIVHFVSSANRDTGLV